MTSTGPRIPNVALMLPRFAGAALDFDGTLTRTGRLAPRTVAGLRAARAGGLRLVLVTGRIVADLRRVCPGCDRLFDRIVAENGAVLAAEGRSRPLSPPLGRELEAALRRRRVRVDRGEVLLATDVKYEARVAAALAETGVRCEPIRNREALMLLPEGLGKASGLAAAAADLGLSPRAFVALGDAENDADLFAAAGLGVAVGNAVPALRAVADVVLDRAGGPAAIAFLLGEVLPGGRRLPALRGPPPMATPPAREDRWKR